MQPQIDVKYGIICDDIRREDTGKYILIGVYTSAIVVPQFPLQMALGIFLRGTHVQEGKVPFTMRVLFMPDEMQVFRMGGTAVLGAVQEGEGSFEFAFSGFAFEAQREGHLSLQFKQHNGPWKEIERLAIKLERKANQAPKPSPTLS